MPPDPHPYDTDLAFVHDQGFGEFARRSAPGLLRLLHEAGVTTGRVVDLGCGSGLWARELVDAGYEVAGVDISPAMIDLARERVPGADFHVGPFLEFSVPPCRAVTALGEVFNYLFDTGGESEPLERVCRNAFDALAPGGLLIFDVAGPGRCRDLKQSFREGDGWACLVEYRHDEPDRLLTRRIVTFRRVDDLYRRHEETHRLRLYDPADVERLLAGVGFDVRTVRAYGEYPLPDGLVGFVARRP